MARNAGFALSTIVVAHRRLGARIYKKKKKKRKKERNNCGRPRSQRPAGFNDLSICIIDF